MTSGLNGPARAAERATAEVYRRAARAWTTGVAVLTARHGEEVFAKTVSSLCTLSLDPPLISVAVDRRSPIVTAVKGSGRYALNVLAREQEPLARRFATPGAGRALGFFTAAPMRPGSRPGGPPVLETCLAWFECGLHHVLPGGDHALLVGRVTAADGEQGDPLLYHDGRFRSLDPGLPAPGTPRPDSARPESSRPDPSRPDSLARHLPSAGARA